MTLQILPTPIGYIGLEVEEQKLCRIHFVSAAASDTAKLTETHRRFIRHIHAYFSHKKPIPLIDVVIPVGTPFQQRVWHALTTIPFGTTLTYGALAKHLNTSAQAIGNACRENPLPIVIPCHRVVAKSGIGGYAGFTEGEKISIKNWLLAHEAQVR